MSNSSVYDFLDYREFLKERIRALREKKQFSFRRFNRQSGFRSPAALKLVLDGKRNLAQDGIYKVIQGLKLLPTEAKFFSHLVWLTQAKSHQEKDYHFRQLAAYRPFRKAREMTALQYDCLSRWYYAAILELIRLHHFEDNPEWIAKCLNPTLSITEVRRALTDLEQLGFISRDPSGKRCKTEATLSTPDEVCSLSIVNFHQQMCDLAKKAVSETSSGKREFSSLTIAISREGFQKIKKRIQEFKKELDGYLEEDSAPKTEVAQINLQVFPLSKEALK